MFLGFEGRKENLGMAMLKLEIEIKYHNCITHFFLYSICLESINLNKSDQKSKQFMANWLENKKRKSDLEEEPSNDNAKKDYSSSTTNKGTNSKVSQHEK